MNLDITIQHHTYYVYENDITDLARVHVGSCGHCDYGRGKGQGRKADNRWLGPFGSAELAMDRAQATGKGTVDVCWFCQSSIALP